MHELRGREEKMPFCRKEKPRHQVINEAPQVNPHYICKDGEPSGFYSYDPKMASLVGGYKETSDESYAKVLFKKYPLGNE